MINGEENVTWIKLYRELLNKAIWLDSSPQHKVVIVTLLLMVNYKEREWLFNGRRFKARAGETVTSIDSIIERAGSGISVQNVRSALDKLKKLGFIEEEVSPRGRLIKIVNWEKYQSNNMEGEPPKFFEKKPLTEGQQLTNKGVTPNKKYNKPKKDKNINKQQKLQVKDRNRVFDYYRCCGFGSLNDGVRDILRAYERDYGEEAVIEAMKISVKANCYKISYVEGVLKNRKKGDGFINGGAREANREAGGCGFAGI